MREVAPNGAKIDAGPTVFTMRWVFDEILEEVGISSLSDRLTLLPLELSRVTPGATAQSWISSRTAIAAPTLSAPLPEARRQRVIARSADAPARFTMHCGTSFAVQPNPLTLVRRATSGAS